MIQATIPAIEARPVYVAGVPDDIYHQDRTAVSSSTLKTVVRKSPAHARADLDSPKADTPALALGRAVHARLLEPDTFLERFAIGPKVDRRTKAGKEAWAAFLEDYPGASILAGEDAATLEGIAASIEAHPLARHAIRDGQAEVSGWFTDPETGVHCRIRPDYLRAADGIMVDLKTTLDASPDAFQRSIHSFGYATQAALYAQGHEAITGEPLRDFLFLAVEKARPFAVGLYRLDETALEVGRQHVRRALRTWADCLESGRWPGYSDRIESISLPVWAITHEDEA